MGFGLSQNKAQWSRLAPVMCRGLSYYVETRALLCAECLNLSVSTRKWKKQKKKRRDEKRQRRAQSLFCVDAS